MPVTFREATLPSGLNIIAECDPAAHTAAVGFFVKTGARDEAAPLMGVSHFLEHMMFKGTPTRSSDDVNREFDAMGARANAYTSTEMTVFYASVLPEFLPTATDLLADMMRPALRDADFTTEKGVILEEIAMYKDEPMWVLYDALMEKYFRGAALGHRVLGTTDTITALPVESMRDYFRTRYSADNTTVALAGRVDFDAVVKQVSDLCAGWTRTDARRVYTPGNELAGAFELTDAKVTRGYRMLVTPGPSATDPRRYAAFVMAQILGASDNSRLHWALIEPGIAEEAEVGFDAMDGLGVTRITVVCEPADLDRAWDIAMRECNALASTITDKDVEMVRSKVATGVTVAGERPEGRMHRLGRQWLAQGRYTTLEEELVKVNAVTVEDVRALLRDFPFAPAMTGTLRPA